MMAITTTAEYRDRDALLRSVEVAGGPRRIVAGFEHSDVAWTTPHPPETWLDDSMSAPALAIDTATGGWFGMTGVSVGYGGAGCGFTVNALTDMGVSVSLARKIAAYRYADVTLEAPEAGTFCTEWPHFGLCFPTRTQQDTWVFVISADSFTRWLDDSPDPTAPDETNIPGGSFFPTPKRTGYLARLLAMFDNPRQDQYWLHDTYRQITVWPTHQAAAAAGHVIEHPRNLETWLMSPQQRTKAYPVEIRQGAATIWIDLPIEKKTSGLPATTLAALAAFGHPTTRRLSRYPVLARAARLLTAVDDRPWAWDVPVQHPESWHRSTMGP